METKTLHYIAIKYLLLGLAMAKNEESLDWPSKILRENPVLIGHLVWGETIMTIEGRP